MREDDNALLTPAQVARLFGVDAKTVSRWATTGRLPCVRTLGGHRRFPAVEVRQLMAPHPAAGSAEGER